MKYGCAHPDNGFDGSDNTKFMMGSSDCIVTWGPMVKLSVSPKAQSRPRALSQKESSYLLRMTGLCSNMLRAWSAVHMWRPSKASNIPLCHWYIKNWGSIASFSPCGREACMTTWIFCTDISFSGPCSKLAHFQIALGERNILIWKIDWLPNPIIPNGALCIFFGYRSGHME